MNKITYRFTGAHDEFLRSVYGICMIYKVSLDLDPEMANRYVLQYPVDEERLVNFDAFVQSLSELGFGLTVQTLAHFTVLIQKDATLLFTVYQKDADPMDVVIGGAEHMLDQEMARLMQFDEQAPYDESLYNDRAFMIAAPGMDIIVARGSKDAAAGAKMIQCI